MWLLTGWLVYSYSLIPHKYVPKCYDFWDEDIGKHRCKYNEVDISNNPYGYPAGMSGMITFVFTFAICVFYWEHKHPVECPDETE